MSQLPNSDYNVFRESPYLIIITTNSFQNESRMVFPTYRWIGEIKALSKPQIQPTRKVTTMGPVQGDDWVQCR